MSRILILEGNEQTRLSMHQCLEANGLYVASTNDHEHALRLLYHFMPDLVVADWQAANGAQLCLNIRAFHHYDHVPILLTEYVLRQDSLAAGSCMKDYDDTPIKARLMSRYGCDEFWAKPGNLEVLIDKVAFLLAVSEQRAERRAELRAEDSEPDEE